MAALNVLLSEESFVNKFTLTNDQVKLIQGNWKRCIDDIFSIWNINKDEVTQFIEQAHCHLPTSKFTAEVSDTETTFLDTKVTKANGLQKSLD